MASRVEKIHYTPDFKKSYKNLPASTQKTIDSKDCLFRENPFHPSLRTHKLHGPLRDLWPFYITKSHRILFEFLDSKTVIFYDVGTHKIYK